MSSLFTKIINGEVPCHKVAENEHCFAFLDIFPIARGHVIVIPKKEVDKFYDLDDNSLQALTSFAKQIAVSMEQVFDCKRIGLSIIGLEVPHTHIHLVPLNEVDDINFSKAKLSLEASDLEAMADKLRTQINQDM